MIVAITGASGLIGSALTRALEARGDIVRPLVRRAPENDREIEWHPERGEVDADGFRGTNAIVNLAGENLAQRWTDDAKRRIRDSRINGTRLLANVLAVLPHRPPALLSASAVGYYGDRGDEWLDEGSPAGGDFLARICAEWEAATAPAEAAGMFVVHLRTGLVLSKDGGALPKMALPFRFGVGGRIGSGKQWVSWIALDDVVGALLALLDEPAVNGPVNLVAPTPVTNAELTTALSHELHRPAFFTVPRFAMTLAFGEMANETLLASQRVRPTRLESLGYRFRHPTIESALAAAFAG